MWIVLSDSDEGCPFPDLVKTHYFIILVERLFYMSIFAGGKFNRFLFGRTRPDESEYK